MNNISSVQEKKDYVWKIWSVSNLDPSCSAPLHYGDFLEITILKNTCADVYIGGKNYTVDGDAAFLVPPGVIHSFTYHSRKESSFFAIDINIQRLKPIFNIEAFLSLYGLTCLNLPVMLADADKIQAIATPIYTTNEPISDSKRYGEIIRFFLDFFQIILPQIQSDETVAFSCASTSDEFQSIFTWTHQNYHRRITIDEAAAVLGYSRNHFCKKFKMMAGISYINFLNNLRVHKASSLLKKGYSIKDVTSMTGFEDTSYFIQQFKKRMGITPKRFMEEYQSNGKKEERT